MKLQLLDELIALGHGKTRSTECVIAISAKNISQPDIERAQKIFNKTASYPARLQSVETLNKFVDSPLETPFHIEVAKITEGNLLALKMSHILGDAVSMFLFLKGMLSEEVVDGVPELKTFPKKKDTPYRGLLNSTLWPGKKEKSFSRKFISVSFEHGEQNAPLWNDLMLYSLLESLPYERKAIWVPVNVRKSFWQGFGNGLSRLRVYPPKGSNLTEKLAHIRKQKQEAMRNGEVALPPPGFDIHNRHQKLLYDLWIQRPWADWGTISLSHLTNSAGFLDGFHKIHGISNLMPSHNGAIFAVTSGGITDFTLTYDPAAASEEESAKLMRDFLTNLRAKL